jgi:hypothetical protein
MVEQTEIFVGEASLWPDGIYKPLSNDGVLQTDAILTKRDGLLTYFSLDYFQLLWIQPKRIMIRRYKRVGD